MMRWIFVTGLLVLMGVGFGFTHEARQLDGEWIERLEALTPEHPEAYFLLAEEIADEQTPAPGINPGSNGSDYLAVARHLFALAGALDPDRFGRSAALALAGLVEPGEPGDGGNANTTGFVSKRRLLALARLLDDRPYGELPRIEMTGGAGSAPKTNSGGGVNSGGGNSGGGVVLSEAFALSRVGRGGRALSLLKKEDAEGLLGQFDHLIPGGRIRFLENCRLYQRGKLRPSLSERDISDMLHLERILMRGKAESWADVLFMGGVFTGGPPVGSGMDSGGDDDGYSGGGGGGGLVEVDPANLGEAFGVEVLRAYWRGGEWVETQE